VVEIKKVPDAIGRVTFAITQSLESAKSDAKKIDNLSPSTVTKTTTAPTAPSPKPVVTGGVLRTSRKIVASEDLSDEESDSEEEPPKLKEKEKK